MGSPVIKIKRSTAAGVIPSAASLQAGELAANITDGKLFIGTGTSVVELTSQQGGSGSVTSVGLSLPNIFTVTGSPVTTSGTLTASLASQTQKTFFAAPSSTNGAPNFRAITPADLASGGTDGLYLKINGGAFSWSSVAGGAGSSPAGSTGSIQINNSGVFSAVDNFKHSSFVVQPSLLIKNSFTVPVPIIATNQAVGQNLNTFATSNNTNIVYFSKIETINLSIFADTYTTGFQTRDAETDYFTLNSGASLPCVTETITGVTVETVLGTPITYTLGSSIHNYYNSLYYLKISGLSDLGLIVGDRIKFNIGFGNPDNVTSPFGTELGIQANTWYTIGLISSILNDFVYVLYKNDTLVYIFQEPSSITNVSVTIDYGNYKPLKLYSNNSLTTKKLFTKLATKFQVRAATTTTTTSFTGTTLSGVSYTNGTNGDGAFLEKSTNGELPSFDGVTLSDNDIVLVKNFTGSAQKYNGIYTVTSTGSTTSKWKLTRHSSYNTQAEFVANDSTRFTIQQGTQASSARDWKLSATLTSVVGTGNIVFVQDTSLAPILTDIPHNLVNGDMVLLYNQTSTFDASGYKKYYTGPSIGGNVFQEPKTYHVINTESSSGSFDISQTSTGSALTVTNIGDLPTNPTFTFFRRMPKIRVDDFSNEIRDVATDLLNEELKYTNCSYDLGTTRSCILHSYDYDSGSNKNLNYLLVTNGLLLNNNLEFYIVDNMVDEYSKEEVGKSLPGGKLFKISNLTYKTYWGGQNYTPQYQTEEYTAITQENNRIGSYARFYIKNLDNTDFQLAPVTNKRGGMVFPYKASYLYSSYKYDQQYVFPKLKYLKLKNNPKVIKVIAGGGATDLIFDQYIRFNPEHVGQSYFKFYTAETVIPKTQYVLNFDLNSSDLYNNSHLNTNYKEFGMYLTTNSKLVLGRSNPLYDPNSITTKTTFNEYTTSPALVDDNNAGIIIKRDGILYDPLLNRMDTDQNFKIYLSLGTSYTENIYEADVQREFTFWILGAFGETLETPCYGGNPGCYYTNTPSVNNPNSYLRWVKFNYADLYGGAQLTAGNGVSIDQPLSLSPTVAPQPKIIKLADEVPINTSLTVPLIKGTAGGDLNITTSNPDTDIILAIPPNNTDIVLSTGSIYITSGLDGGDIYVQSAEDVYLTSQNVRVSGNLIVDGYIQSGTGFQGDNSDAEEPITGLVMDGGTF